MPATTYSPTHVWRGRPRPRKPGCTTSASQSKKTKELPPAGSPFATTNLTTSKAAGEGARSTSLLVCRYTFPKPKGKGRRDFSQRPLFMPATTYSPTHFRVQYNRPGGA